MIVSCFISLKLFKATICWICILPKIRILKEYSFQTPSKREQQQNVQWYKTTSTVYGENLI